jgi:uncharacterized protein YqcC (DUF446 family)
MPDRYAIVSAAIAGVEAEMKSIGYWSTAALLPEAYDFHQAFAMDTMAFSQWLQFVFIPRVRSIVDQRSEFPAKSMVAAQAVREFDGDTNATRLVSLLSEFDALFND